jgi:gliding motility-associated lipoprotein GldD
MSKFKFLFLIASLFMACSKLDSAYQPKPKGFNRIPLPSHEYRLYNGKEPYTFEVSKSAEVLPDESSLSEPNWLIINYPELGAKVQFTYKPLHNNLIKLNEHVADAYKLAAKHQVKASSQTEQILTMKNGKKAVVIELEGEVPSHYQFYLTDTTHHYLRGVLYLNKATLNDSLMPIVDYLKVDCRRILETLNWKQ